MSDYFGNTYEVKRDRNKLVLDQLGKHLQAEPELELVEDLGIQDLLLEPDVLRVRTLIL